MKAHSNMRLLLRVLHYASEIISHCSTSAMSTQFLSYNWAKIIDMSPMYEPDPCRDTVVSTTLVSHRAFVLISIGTVCTCSKLSLALMRKHRQVSCIVLLFFPSLCKNYPNISIIKNNKSYRNIWLFSLVNFVIRYVYKSKRIWHI